MSLPQRVKVYEALCGLYARRLSFVNIRRIAKRANVPLTTASYELARLEEYKLVVRRGNRGGWRPRLVYERTYRHLLGAYRRSHDYVCVDVVANLSDRSYRTTLEYLHQMRRAGVVVRYGTGWKPVRQADVVPVGSKALDVLSMLYYDRYDYVASGDVAARLGVSMRYVQRLMRAYEAMGMVERLGVRGGWRPAVGEVAYGEV